VEGQIVPPLKEKMTNTVISYPIPPYSNPPIEPQFYQPKVFVISGISTGVTTTITTTLDMDYVIGQEIRLLIPSKYGARGLNEQTGIVISIPSSNQVEVDINSNGVDPFISSPTFLPFQSKTPPQIVAIGDVNSGPINAQGRVNNGTFIQGSFINISPL
jgi:hypothetical protein